MIDHWQLTFRQNLPLELKEQYSLKRIKDWYEANDGNVYISFSGGKDSTVLLHLVRTLYPDVPAVFVDTGLEYPEIRAFVRTIDNVVWLKPRMKFHEVIEKYGYPVVSKEIAMKISRYRNTKNPEQKIIRLYGKANPITGKIQAMGKISEKWKFLIDSPFKISDNCCRELKKNPIISYERKAGRQCMVGTMAVDSVSRKTNYLKNGCNSFGERKISKPISFWKEKDIWEYIKKYNISYSKIYDMGEKRTGCMFCMFGVHLEKGENRFQRMRISHPKQYNFCINILGIGKCLDYLGIPHAATAVQKKLF